MMCSVLQIYLGGLALVLSYDDLSLNKDTNQSHTYTGSSSMYYARNAVDRNLITCMRTKNVGPNSPEKTVWWKVDLGWVYSIYSVTILFKNYNGHESRQRGRFAGFSIFVSNTGDKQGATLCYKDGPQLPPLNFTTTCPEYGRYVIFYNERLDGVIYPDGYQLANAYTELCEVIVEGCQNSIVYGSNCDKPCPINCKDNMCHIQLGNCFACKPGWTGNSCITKCMEGWYGSNCSQLCEGHCRSGTPCNHVTGLCDVGCEDGWYGIHCSKPCEGHCRDNIICNHVTGQCDGGCDAGWTGYFCNKECEVGEYGFDCVNTCSGHCFGDSPCNKQTGHCERGCKVGYINSDCGTTCQEGYYGKNCSMVCHPNCTTCRNTDGFCTCGAGWIGPNCSLECVWSYGGHCQYPCSRHCINQTCDRFNGSCLLGYSNEYMYCESADSQQSPTTLTISIAGFTVSLVINIIVISAIMLRRRKKSFNWNNIQCCVRTTFKTKQNKTEDEEPHYQELKERKNENNYQNLT